MMSSARIHVMYDNAGHDADGFAESLRSALDGV